MLVFALPDSSNGEDQHDIEKLKPIGNKYLSVLFPTPKDWDSEAWGYASDYRHLDGAPEGRWQFAVYASEDAGPITLNFEGAPEVLNKLILRGNSKRGRLTQNGDGSYSFNPKPGLNKFVLRVR